MIDDYGGVGYAVVNNGRWCYDVKVPRPSLIVHLRLFQLTFGLRNDLAVTENLSSLLLKKICG